MLGPSTGAGNLLGARKLCRNPVRATVTDGENGQEPGILLPTMSRLSKHVKNKFVAGLIAAIPLAITLFLIFYVDSMVQKVVRLPYPFLGVLLSLAVLYCLGVFVTSLVGQYLLRTLNRVLERIPGLRDLYRTWKQLVVTPELNSGMFAKVVLLPDESGQHHLLGFSTGRTIIDGGDRLCVFVPNSPNPITGRLYFTSMKRCQFPPVSSKDALKAVVSSGNYMPVGFGAPVPPSST
jgi:uncharacterized membrane protein